jgi:hypothetical protein
VLGNDFDRYSITVLALTIRSVGMLIFRALAALRLIRCRESQLKIRVQVAAQRLSRFLFRSEISCLVPDANLMNRASGSTSIRASRLHRDRQARFGEQLL